MPSPEFIIRRVISWPLVLVGAALVVFGGEFIRLGAWIASIDISEVDE